MRTGNITGAEHNRFATEALKIRRFGAERYCFGTMTGQSFRNPHQFSVFRLLEGRHFGEQRL